jgi:hypothetical protein
MLANIKTLEPILDKLFKENGTFGLMQDNGEFPKRLKLLASAFDYKCTNDSLDTFKDFCYNLFYIAERDLSLAHCIHHNHMSRIAIELGPDSAIKSRLLQERLHETIYCNSAAKVVDTIRYDVELNQLLPGKKYWLSNLESGSVVTIEVLTTDADASATARHTIHREGESPDIYMMCLDLTKINHTKSVGKHESPNAVGMKGAAPGTLTLLEPIAVGTDACYIIRKNYREKATEGILWHDNAFWVTVHLGVVVGLYKELVKFPEVKSTELKNQLRTLELEIATLKILWEEGHNKIDLNDSAVNNPVLSVTPNRSFRSIEYALSKKVLLNLINFTLEIGLNQFIDDTGPQWVRFSDAITYVTHLASLYRCNNKYQYTNSMWN